MTQNSSKFLSTSEYFPFFLLFFVVVWPVHIQAKFSLGVDYLEETKFGILKGKKVGLLTHPAGVNSRGVSTVDVLRDFTS